MCKVNAAMIVADGAAVGTALENLAEAIQPSDPDLAAKLNSAGEAVVNATQDWKEGDALTEVEDAEQAAIAVLNVIPVASTWAPLVAIAFTALNLLIANGQTQHQQSGNMVQDAHMLLIHAQTLNADSPWHGKAVIKHHFLRTPRQDFEHAWADAAKPLGVALVTV